MWTCAMPATLRESRYVWVTWLSRLMAGEISCEWAPWFRTNFKDWDRPPSDFDEAQWRVAHTRLLRDIRSARRGFGEESFVERQGQFYYERDSGLVLSGTPDLVTVTGNEGIVHDAKTGKQRASDAVQVKIYMHCLPLAHAAFRGKLLSGRVVYADHEINIPAGAVDREFVDQFEYFLDILDSNEEPERIPSEPECGFCNIGAGDCPGRFPGV